MTTCNIESGVQLFSRVNRKHVICGINPHLFPDGGPFPNQVIEITGHKKCDKSELLIDFIVKCILPQEYKSDWKSSGVVLIICEHQINLFKIIKVLEAHLKNNQVIDSRKEIVEEALKNITIFNCYSSEDMEIAIMNLERLILAKQNINLVIIDNITAYYWIAKMQNNNLSYYQHSLKIFQLVFNVIKTLNIVFLYVRNDKEEIIFNKKSFRNVDYKIDVQNSNQERCFKTTISNFEKQMTNTVFYKLNVLLQFYNKLDEANI